MAQSTAGRAGELMSGGQGARRARKRRDARVRVERAAGARRVIDARGVAWVVRDFWSVKGHALHFMCTVPGVRSELHTCIEDVATLSDEALGAMISLHED